MLSRYLVFVRAEAVVREQRRLEREPYPRLQMILITALTGACGLLPSFLFLIWLWLRTKAQDYVDVPDVPNLSPSGGGSGSLGLPMRTGGGADFAGA